MSNETNEVIEHLDLAVQAAERQKMSTSEIIGLLFFYAHNLAQQARDSALQAQQQADDEQAPE